MASGDVSGSLRIWDMVNQEHILKIESRPFSGIYIPIHTHFTSNTIPYRLKAKSTISPGTLKASGWSLSGREKRNSATP